MATFELKDLGNEIWNIMTSFIAHGIKTPALETRWMRRVSKFMLHGKNYEIILR